MTYQTIVKIKYQTYLKNVYHHSSIFLHSNILNRCSLPRLSINSKSVSLILSSGTF